MNATLTKNHRPNPYAHAHLPTQPPPNAATALTYNNLSSSHSNLSRETQGSQKGRWGTPLAAKRSFEDYYACKMQEEGDRPYRFREILTEMNGRVKNVKKQRVRRKHPDAPHP